MNFTKGNITHSVISCRKEKTATGAIKGLSLVNSTIFDSIVAVSTIYKMYGILSILNLLHFKRRITVKNEKQTTEIVQVEEETTNPANSILSVLDMSDYSQFLYNTNYGGKPGQDFTAEGIKTIGLQHGISTGEVKIDFINDEKTEALFFCTATDRQGDTSERVVKQSEFEHGKKNPNWIEKGIARAERNAIKARLPIQLFKTVLQKAIAAGEAQQSEIVEIQNALKGAWKDRDQSLSHITKAQFYSAAQAEYGDSENWNAENWQQVLNDLTQQAKWVVSILDNQNNSD